MRQKGMKVNPITYNAAITALATSARNKARDSARLIHAGKPYSADKSTEFSDDEGLWTRAMILLDQMREDGLKPDGFSFSSAISCCGAEGRWKEALELMELMKRGGPRTRPNKISYTAAISKFHVGCAVATRNLHLGPMPRACSPPSRLFLFYFWSNRCMWSCR
jgi:pentatricopeptide repeat protein